MTIQSCITTSLVFFSYPVPLILVQKFPLLEVIHVQTPLIVKRVFYAWKVDEGIKECQEAECLTSLDCSFQQYCNTTYSCIDGCESDTDCYSGEQCNKDTNTCESYGCRSTQIRL